jgi:hypothetical protein
MTEQIVRQFHFYKRLSPLTTCVADRRVTIHPVASPLMIIFRRDSCPHPVKVKHVSRLFFVADRRDET